VKESITPEDEALLQKYCVNCIMGKGLVSIIIPRDCEQAMLLLADSVNLSEDGVAADNTFLFVYTSHSLDNPTGYNEIRDVSQEINIPVVTATSTHHTHRSSTFFGDMEGFIVLL